MPETQAEYEARARTQTIKINHEAWILILEENELGMCTPCQTWHLKADMENWRCTKCRSNMWIEVTTTSGEKVTIVASHSQMRELVASIQEKLGTTAPEPAAVPSREALAEFLQTIQPASDGWAEHIAGCIVNKFPGLTVTRSQPPRPWPGSPRSKSRSRLTARPGAPSDQKLGCWYAAGPARHGIINTC